MIKGDSEYLLQEMKNENKQEPEEKLKNVNSAEKQDKEWLTPDCL